VPKVGFAGVAVLFMEIPTYWLSWGHGIHLKRKINRTVETETIVWEIRV